MSFAHASLDQLSGFIDAELAPRQRRAVETHLESCETCRRRLAGLESVVGELSRLEAQAPPSHLGAVVRSGARRLSNQPRLRDRLERAAAQLTHQPGLVPVFGVVLALGAILYLFSFGVARYNREPGVQVIFESAVDGATGEEAREAGGRVFTFISGVWVERGLEGETPDRELANGRAPVGEPELAAEIEALRALEPAVRFRFREEVVEIRWRPAARR